MTTTFSFRRSDIESPRQEVGGEVHPTRGVGCGHFGATSRQKGFNCHWLSVSEDYSRDTGNAARVHRATSRMTMMTGKSWRWLDARCCSERWRISCYCVLGLNAHDSRGAHLEPTILHPYDRRHHVLESVKRNNARPSILAELMTVIPLILGSNLGFEILAGFQSRSRVETERHRLSISQCLVSVWTRPLPGMSSPSSRRRSRYTGGNRSSAQGTARLCDLKMQLTWASSHMMVPFDNQCDTPSHLCSHDSQETLRWNNVDDDSIVAGGHLEDPFEKEAGPMIDASSDESQRNRESGTRPCIHQHLHHQCNTSHCLQEGWYTNRSDTSRTA